MQVEIERKSGIAVLTIDRPPVNALSHDLRSLIAKRLQEVSADPSFLGIVLACSGRTFVAGADISELGESKSPMLRDIIDMLEALKVLSVAALHGTALGGGFELALGCTYRVALPDAKIGFPEVKLGLLPGAGGTVRTSYLAGPEATLKLAGSGELMSARDAARLGLVDCVLESDLVDGAVRFLLERIDAGNVPQPVSKRRATQPDNGLTSLVELEKELCRKARSTAPALVAQAVRAGRDRPFEEAMRVERELFEDALADPRSHALRHLFFAERTAAKLDGDEGAIDPLKVEKIAVIGSGTMGRGIAMAFANNGYEVVVRETDPIALDRGKGQIASTYQTGVTRGSLSQEEADLRISRIRGTTDVAELAEAQLIIEAAFEDMAVKKAIFSELDAVANPNAILATNTSYLDVNEIAESTTRPEAVVGLHFFSPAHIMKLVEVVRGRQTAPIVVATALKVVRALRKQAVVVGVCRGFVGNRMLAARNLPLTRMLLEGAEPSQIDAAFRSFGWPMGPCEMQDLAGLDISWRNRKAQGLSDPLPDRLCELGRLGQKTGAGWYTYESDSRKPKPDKGVLEIATALSKDMGIERRNLTDEEIIRRTHDPMIAEGRKILNEGIAARSSDIDVVWANGYGFPRDLGGPMYWDDAGRRRLN